MSDYRDSKNNIGAVLFAAAIGFAAGILLAPKSGKETREDIMQFTHTSYDKLSQEAAALRERAQSLRADLTAASKKELESLQKNLDKRLSRVREVGKRVKDAPDNEELQIAMAEAKDAIAHIRAFLRSL